jgi:hypothetical protein
MRHTKPAAILIGLVLTSAMLCACNGAVGTPTPAGRAALQETTVASRFPAYQISVTSGGVRSPSRETSVTVYDLPEATERAGFNPSVPKSDSMAFQGAEARAISSTSNLYGGPSSLVLHYAPDVAVLIVPFSSEENALRIKASLFSSDAEDLYLKHADLSVGIKADYLARGRYKHPDGHFSTFRDSLVVWVDGSTYYLISSPTLPAPALLDLARSIY